MILCDETLIHLVLIAIAINYREIALGKYAKQLFIKKCKTNK